MTAIVLLRPKFEANVGMVVRLAAAYQIPKVFLVQPRYTPAADVEGRTPRELRMFKQVMVEVVPFGYGLSAPTGGGDLIAVERRTNAESLVDFVHPTDGFPCTYVFGPEDGGIDQGTLRQCSRFVQIPVGCSLNLATAVATVLWDRRVKDGSQRQE